MADDKVSQQLHSVKSNKNKGISEPRINRTGLGTQRALLRKRGRIPIDDLHKSSSEGEGACSRTCAGRSHLPLRGKLGWMTPRARSKKEPANGMRLSGLSFPSEGPFLFQPRFLD